MAVTATIGMKKASKHAHPHSPRPLPVCRPVGNKLGAGL
jgi:hypothetical protein